MTDCQGGIKSSVKFDNGIHSFCFKSSTTINAKVAQKYANA